MLILYGTRFGCESWSWVRASPQPVIFFASIKGPDGGGPHPPEGTPWVIMLVCATPWGMEFLRCSLAVLGFSQPKTPSYIHTVSTMSCIGNGDFCVSFGSLGPSNAIDSKFCVVTPSSNYPRGCPQHYLGNILSAYYLEFGLAWRARAFLRLLGHFQRG